MWSSTFRARWVLQHFTRLDLVRRAAGWSSPGSVGLLEFLTIIIIGTV